MHDHLKIEINLATQTLTLRDATAVISQYAVSTARNGPGEREHSECTPRGPHLIAAKIGAEAAPNTVFVGRRPTGEVYSAAFAATQPADRDWIVTRILWLAGCTPGYNQGDGCDTYARYIYVHGTPDETSLGVPGSRGCIRMRNADVIELFAQVDIGTPVFITE